MTDYNKQMIEILESIRDISKRLAKLENRVEGLLKIVGKNRRAASFITPLK